MTMENFRTLFAAQYSHGHEK